MRFFSARCPLSLIKSLADHSVRSPATETVGQAQKFVCCRSLVTAIIKVESRDLDRRRGYGAAARNEWKVVRYRRSDRAIAYRFGSGRATFVPMMQSTYGARRNTGNGHHHGWREFDFGHHDELF